jgi:preprotein translocase subunit SecE
VARDRQRAKQRKARRAGQNPGPSSSEPHRSNVPGELDHASGEADEFDAALVAGAGGVPVDGDAEPAVDDDAEPAVDDDEQTANAPRDDEAGVLDEDGGDVDVDYGVEYDDEDDEDDEPLADDEEEDDRAVAAGGVPARRRGSRADAATSGRAASPARGPGRFVAFLRASWAELQRVQWPDRRQVFQATAVVLGFVVVAGLYLGVADRVAQELVDLII